MFGAPRMGLSAVLARLVQTDEGRRAIEHLHAASHADTHAKRRSHMRIAIRFARQALTRINGKSK